MRITKTVQLALANAKKKKYKKQIFVEVPEPWPCVILNVDWGNCSGWSIWLRGVLLDFGEIHENNLDEIREVISKALMIALLNNTVAVMAIEKEWTFSAAGGGFQQISGSGEARGAWRNAWVTWGHGGKKTMISVHVMTWRAKVVPMALGQKREMAKAFDALMAQHIVKEHGTDECKTKDIGPDSAAAICIGKWSSTAGQIAKALKKVLPKVAKECLSQSHTQTQEQLMFKSESTK